MQTKGLLNIISAPQMSVRSTYVAQYSNSGTVRATHSAAETQADSHADSHAEAHAVERETPHVAAPTAPKRTTVPMGQGRGEAVRDPDNGAGLLEDDGGSPPIVPWSVKWLSHDIDRSAVAGALLLVPLITTKGYDHNTPTLHQRCLITHSTVIPDYLPQSEHPPETTASTPGTNAAARTSVSYTHLTLPTILLV